MPAVGSAREISMLRGGEVISATHQRLLGVRARIEVVAERGHGAPLMLDVPVPFRPVPLVINPASAGRDGAKREQDGEDCAPHQPDVLLTTAEFPAEPHRERQRDERCGAVQPVEEL
jgi:hypothetical protein